MPRFLRFICLLSGLVFLVHSTPAAPKAADDSTLIRERDALRWQGVTRQAYDFSCGTGAISNFVSLLGGKPPAENALIRKYAELRGQPAAEAVRKQGFSLLDLKILMTSLGYKTAGVRYEAGTMPENPEPMIVHLANGDQTHFTVFAGVDEDTVILHDSIQGRLRLRLELFLSLWDGTALLLLEMPVEGVDLPQPSPALARDQANPPANSPSR